MEFSRQEYWSGLPFSSLGELPDPGIEPGSSYFAGRFFFVPSEPPGKPHFCVYFLNEMISTLLKNKGNQYVIIKLFLMPVVLHDSVL